MGSASCGQVWASAGRQPKPVHVQLFQGWNVCGIHCDTIPTLSGPAVAPNEALSIPWASAQPRSFLEQDHTSSSSACSLSLTH